MKPVRVLIVEDSPVVREHLRRIISTDPRFEIAGMAATGEEAVGLVHRVAPNVISMDIRLPGIDGFEATRRIMAQRPTPIVVVSGIGSAEIGLSMQALKAGALAVVEKPVAATDKDYEALARHLRTQLAIMSEVKVVRRRALPEQLSGSALQHRYGRGGSFRVLGVASSTGGPAALQQLICALGPDFSLPIAVVQHMTPGFVEGFADWLSTLLPMPVEIVNSRVATLPGHVYLAAGDRHLAIGDGWVEATNDVRIRNHRPSADVLFSSMARSVGASAIGVLLTGMGDDGAAGLKELRAAGGFTIAEHESTAVVYGMPGAAVRIDAVCESLPLGDIAPRISELVTPRQEAN